MTITITINQTHDAHGSYAPAVFSEPIYPGLKKSAPAAIWQFLEPLNPTPTGDYQSGVYWYHDPERGKGWLTVNNAGVLTVDRVNQLVRLAQIERKIGQKNPERGAELGMASPLVMTMSNPYGQILLGAVILTIVLFFTAKAIASSFSVGLLIFLTLLGLIALGVSGYMFVTGFRRRKWWHNARRACLEDGGPIPDDLKVFW